MKLFYHASLLLILALPTLAAEPENLEKESKGKERKLILRDEERSMSSKDEERGFSSQRESLSESPEASQEWPIDVPTAEEEAHSSLLTNWTGDHLPLGLREPAREFYEFWQPISEQFERNPFANFINQVVEKDGIGINSTTVYDEDINYNFSSSESLKEKEKEWKTFIDIAAGDLFIASNMLDNPFADYFWGVFAYFGFLEKKSKLSTKQRYKRAAKLLDYASKKHYLRATNFMLEKDLRHAIRLGKEELISRKNMHLAPLQVIIDHVKSNSYQGPGRSEKVDALSHLIDLLPGYTRRYWATYNQWVDELTTLLQSSKSIPSGWVQNLSTLTLNVFGTGVLLTTATNSLGGGGAVISETLGITQGTSAITSLLVGGMITPWARNWWSSLSFYDNEGNFQWRPRVVCLLDSNLPRDEIRDSARIIILYGLLYNAEKVNNGIDMGSDRSKKYIRKLRDIVLSSKYGPTEALGKIILIKEATEFEY